MIPRHRREPHSREAIAPVKVDAIAVYTNTVPAGAFRGYGLPQTLIAVVRGRMIDAPENQSVVH
jgi:CO/xanthine dehydrogenase Mo-binding subunit